MGRCGSLLSNWRSLLNASLSETQGLTYIEALAAGLPVIVKYDQVLEDVVKDYETGYSLSK